MVYKFKVLSDEDSKFYMEIEILSNQTLYDLHDLIQEELEYDRSHLASFFVASHSWRRLKEIPLIVMDNSIEGVVTMEKAVLKDYVKDAHQKFIYQFDYLNDRCFYLELIETKPESPNMYYPVCTEFRGEIPPQIGQKNKKNNIFEEDDEELLTTSSKKNIPLLEDDLEDIPDVPLDKDVVPPIDLELDEEIKGEEEDFEDDYIDDDLVNEEDESFENDENYEDYEDEIEDDDEK